MRRAPHACGRQPLRLLERRRLRAHVDAVGERGDVERQRALARAHPGARVGARTALVAGHVKAARVAGRVRAQRIEVGRVRLWGGRHPGRV